MNGSMALGAPDDASLPTELRLTPAPAPLHQGQRLVRPGPPGRVNSCPQRTARMIVAGTRVDLCGSPHVLDMVRDRLAGGKPLAIGSVNLDHIHHFGGIERSRLNLPDERPTHEWLLLADGQPIVDRANDLTGTKWPRLTGSDLLPDILRVAETMGSSVGFVGGTPRVHELLGKRLRRDYPALDVVGYWEPDRTTVESPTLAREMAEQVRTAGADIVVVSLGKPTQELWIEEFGDVTGARLLLAFGAAADFMAGEVSRAPHFFSEHGLEWLFRLAMEPRRLARRYVVQGPEAWFRLRGAYLVADSDPSTEKKGTTAR